MTNAFFMQNLMQNLNLLIRVLIKIYSVLSRFKRRLFILRDINGPLLAIKSLILYIGLH
jgi:hypothetical protein